MSRRWTSDEDAKLMELYPRVPTHSIASLLTRSSASVRNRAKEIGIHTLRTKAKALRLRKWSNAEISELRGMYQNHTCEEISRKIGRTVESVKHAVKTRGMRKAPPRECSRAAIGTERIVGGYAIRKINDTGLFSDDWRAVHVVEWERVHGPVPPKHVLNFKDGNHLNACVENLILVPRGLHLRNSSAKFRSYPPELRRAILALSRLKRELRRQREEQDAGS